MMHVSIPLENTVEFISQTEISPLISRVEIKVCYLGENRNSTYIDKNLAIEMGKKLPGTPIVGHFIDEDADYGEHDRELEANQEGYAIVDITKPCGFVDLNARVWFQTFLDDGAVEREYLCTEGYIWTGVYPESSRITEKGNNQSMELKNVKGNWTNLSNSSRRFFIINEAIIEKLCVLGENHEPCFEGAQLQTKFSLEAEFAEFKNTMFSMIQDLKETLNEGGSKTFMAEEMNVNPVVEEEVTPPAEETPAVVEEENLPVVEEEVPAVEEPAPETPVEEVPAVEEPASVAYNLEEIEEYVTLRATHEELQSQYAALEEERNNLLAEIEPLRTFKVTKDRESKQSMIDSFYMLSAEDKQDVVNNIDSYSLDEIESKLAVICVRNKVSFALDNEEDKAPETTFSLNGLDTSDVDDAPEWVKAVRQTAKNMK